MWSDLEKTKFDFIASVKNEKGKHNAIICCRLLGQPLSLLLIKAVACPGFTRHPGHLLMGSDLQKPEFDFIAFVKKMRRKEACNFTGKIALPSFNAYNRHKQNNLNYKLTIP